MSIQPFALRSGALTTVRKVDATDTINSLTISSSDSVWIANGGMSTPVCIANDAKGNLYVIDEGSAGHNNVVYKINLASLIATRVAGNGGNTDSGFGGAATSASIANPFGICLDNAGNIYITDLGYVLCVNTQATTQTILNVSINAGSIAVVAGNGTPGFAGDGGQATAGGCKISTGITAIDDTGTLYIADASYRIRKVATSGVISTIAGTGSFPGASNGDGGSATACKADSSGFAFDADNNIYFSQYDTVRVINTQGTTQTFFGVSVAAGNVDHVAGTPGTGGFSGDGGPAINAKITGDGLSIDSSGNLYLCDTNRIRQITVSDNKINTIAGTGTSGNTGDGGLATSARILTQNNLLPFATSSSALNTLSGGPFQLGNGAPIANGKILLELSHDENYVTGKNQIVAGLKVTVNLDSNGNVSGSPTIWPNDTLTPVGSNYLMRIFDSTGTEAWRGEHTLTVSSSPAPFPITSGIDLTH